MINPSRMMSGVVRRPSVIRTEVSIGDGGIEERRILIFIYFFISQLYQGKSHGKIQKIWFLFLLFLFLFISFILFYFFNFIFILLLFYYFNFPPEAQNQHFKPHRN